jgi:hypothetical protein
MSRHALPAMLIATLMLAACHAGNEGLSPRARAFAALPEWTGQWETEAAVQLRATGRLVKPQLWGKPPYNTTWEQKTRPAGRNAADTSPDLPATTKMCSPSGFPAVMEFPVPDMLIEMLVTPEQTLLVSSESTIRHIYTDGRGHPRADELWPTAEGHSIGHWDGDTLTIDTVARKEGALGPWPDAAVLSEHAHFTERLRLIDMDHLQNEMVIEDPERLSKPWTITIRYARVKDLDRMIPVNCDENDRNPVVDGHFIIAPP